MTQHQQILNALLAAGPRGLTALEIIEATKPHAVLNYTARLSELGIKASVETRGGGKLNVYRHPKFSHVKAVIQTERHPNSELFTTEQTPYGTNYNTKESP